MVTQTFNCRTQGGERKPQATLQGQASGAGLEEIGAILCALRLAHIRSWSRKKAPRTKAPKQNKLETDIKSTEPPARTECSCGNKHKAGTNKNKMKQTFKN